MTPEERIDLLAAYERLVDEAQAAVDLIHADVEKAEQALTDAKLALAKLRHG